MPSPAVLRYSVAAEQRRIGVWFVYIVKCSNRALYTGITDNFERRIQKHNSKRGGHYTRSFGPVKLLWKERHPDKSSALKREAQIKDLTHREKQALIDGNLKLLKEL